MLNLLQPGTEPTVVADGLIWVEGPVWVARLGGLLVSDVKGNTMWRIAQDDGGAWSRRVFLRPSGYAGPEPPGIEHGSNGLALDAEARVVLCSHGERGVFRLDEDRWLKHPLATHADEGGQTKRLNSPNDVARHPATGALYFTDPPYGLDDPALRELTRAAVYCIDPDDGTLTVASEALYRPNGVGFTPDGKTALVACSDDHCPGWWAFPVHDDGTFGAGTLFHDAAPYLAPPQSEERATQAMPDGFTFDDDGRVWSAGPLGLHVFAADGTALGTMDLGRKVSNCAFGEDGHSLFVTATDRVYRLRTITPGPVG
ncbi:MAG: SMP-30/gluconolactonase/LRE family protein, partial [Bacteroidota bacterium]